MSVMMERDGLLSRVCLFVTVWLHQCVDVCVCLSVCMLHIGSSKTKKVKMNRGFCGPCVSFCAYLWLWLHRSQRLMTFACCCCEQSDLAVLIKTNGTDHSLLIVFHWQMAPLSPEDCCRDLACLEHTDFTNENCRSVSVCASVCVCE